jgi:hypothetical protein
MTPLIDLSTEENGGEDWEVRVDCARNMPWRPKRSEFARIFSACFTTRGLFAELDPDP